MALPLSTQIEYLNGIGAQRAALLQKELHIYTLYDLLSHYPFRYVDRTKFHNIADVQSDIFYIQLKIKIDAIHTTGDSKKKRLIAKVSDNSGSMELIWFQGIQYVEKKLDVGQTYIVFGKPNEYKGTYSIMHPELEVINATQSVTEPGLQPVYPTTELLRKRFLDTKGLERIIKEALKLINEHEVKEFLSQEIVQNLSLISPYEALVNIHFPRDESQCQRAIYRLKLEELFWLQLNLQLTKDQFASHYKGFIFSKLGNNFTTFYEKHLPFALTNAQKRVVKEIRKDVLMGKQMNRLLQGDVGSGKTIVALIIALMALDNGYQACVMAPTDILARQHLESFTTLLKQLPISIKLLTGSVVSSVRKLALAELASGELQIVIGTHALIEDPVIFKNLGLVIIDEQHRFGVEQRSKLWRKNISPPHVLVMTATPIPRTLAMTFWGDLEVSVIDELPPGRTPIATHHYYEKDRLKLFQFLKYQIELGQQVYIVYPLIEESETLDLKNVFEGQEVIENEFPRPKYNVAIMHGRMKQVDKEFEMERFKQNKTQLMVSTTVIEVGVNVPNASVMVIENAERFGLSQLHQLRGRVGRGAAKSFCFLMTKDALGADSRHRMKVMCTSNDGFFIAEEDLKLRGPGNIQGTQQSGLQNFKLADLKTDGDIVLTARTLAQDILKNDPLLHHKSNALLRIELARKNKPSTWGKIS